MPRPLRFIPEHSLVEITTRTLQSRLLLKPSPELTEIILGIIGKAQELYGMTIHAFVFLSTHAHFLLSPTSAGQLALFMQFVNANVAKEAGRLHLWRERLWSRRYRSIVVADEEAAHARIRYVLAHSAKEGLLASPGAWPGPNCIATLTAGALLRGTWFDRSKEFLARQRGEHILPCSSPPHSTSSSRRCPACWTSPKTSVRPTTAAWSARSRSRPRPTTRKRAARP